MLKENSIIGRSWISSQKMCDIFGFFEFKERMWCEMYTTIVEKEQTFGWKVSCSFCQKWFSLSRLFCTIWLISQSYFSVTFEVTLVWLPCFFCFFFSIVTMSTPIIMKSCRKFLWSSSILHVTSFGRNKMKLHS